MPFAPGILVRSVVVFVLMLTWGASAQDSTPAVNDATPTVPPAALGMSYASAYQACRTGCDAHRELSDLTPLNFFTEGWDEAWAHRHGDTPDMSLLRVTTNFLEREFRLDYVFTAVNNNAKEQDTQVGDGLIAYGINRRLMVEVVGSYQWNVPPSGYPTENGAAVGAVLRFQLVDTPTGSYAFQYRLNTPNKGLGQTTTGMQYALAGWQNVTAWIPGLTRFGLYYSFQYENLVGPHKATQTLNDFTYVISFARTWTPANMPVIGDFTTFLEFAGVTNLDGSAAGTTISITPGIRFWFARNNSITFGIDFPLTTNPAYSVVYRLNYILNF
ncbi:MAG: hypothetical protein ACLQDQ_14430 [Myxococcaceae bacterium]